MIGWLHCASHVSDTSNTFHWIRVYVGVVIRVTFTKLYLILKCHLTGWVQKPLMKLYVECCEDLSEQPNMKLLKRLYDLEVGYLSVVLLLLSSFWSILTFSEFVSLLTKSYDTSCLIGLRR